MQSEAVIGLRLTRMTAVGRNDSSVSGCLRASDVQRRLSGDESEGLSVATRPVADVSAGEIALLKRPLNAKRSDAVGRRLQRYARFRSTAAGGARSPHRGICSQVPLNSRCTSSQRSRA